MVVLPKNKEKQHRIIEIKRINASVGLYQRVLIVSFLAAARKIRRELVSNSKPIWTRWSTGGLHWLGYLLTEGECMRTFIVVLGLLFASNVLAAPLKVVTDEWEGYTSKEGKGYYMDLLRAIYNDPADSLNVSVLPYARSLAMVKNGTADMVLGVYFGEIPDKHMAAYVVEQDLVDVVVSTATAKAWKGMASLEGKSVLAKIGYAFDAITDVKMKYTEKTSLANMLKMMSAGRADAVLDYRADLEPLMEGAGLAKDKYTIIESVLSSPIYFGFADSPKGNAAKARFEKRFKELYESGDIKKMMQSNLGHSKGLTKTLRSWK
mgnify:CR=1 FL=1